MTMQTMSCFRQLVIKQPRLKQRLLIAILFVIAYLVHDIISNAHDLVSPKRPGLQSNNLNRTATIISSSSTTTTNNQHIHTTNAPHAYTESHSPYHIMDPNIRISFQLHTPSSNYPYPSKFLSVVPYMCGVDKAPLPPSLSSHTILNFTTSIATDLKIVHIGDSLGQQFVQGFDASVLGVGYETNRNVLAEYFYEGGIWSHNCLSVAAPIRGGGISSYWRVTDLMSTSNYAKEGRCAKEELQLKQRVGWSMEQSIALVDHVYSDSTNIIDEEEGGDNKQQDITTFPVGTFDCVVMRIPHGWMDIADITKERIIEAINLAHDNLGVQTVIITTLPLNNNVLDAFDWKGIFNINEMVRDIARTWTAKPGGKGVQYILVQEFGNLTNQILWRNARHLGYNVSFSEFKQQNNGWELSGVDFLLDRLPLAKRKWPPSIPMVCAKPPGVDEKDNACIRNKISTDGIHWCIETLGPRYSTSIACLLGCVYNGKDEPNVNLKKDMDRLRKCEQACNEQFMSILPVNDQWIDSGITLFSQR